MGFNLNLKRNKNELSTQTVINKNHWAFFHVERNPNRHVLYSYSCVLSYQSLNNKIHSNLLLDSKMISILDWYLSEKFEFRINFFFVVVRISKFSFLISIKLLDVPIIMIWIETN